MQIWDGVKVKVGHFIHLGKRIEEEEEHFNKCYRAIVDSDFDDNNLINEFEYLYKKHRISNPYDLIIILED